MLNRIITWSLEHRFLVEQYDQCVNANYSWNDHPTHEYQVEDRQDDGQNARPVLELEQAIACHKVCDDPWEEKT